jgi:hypothetical protein
MPAFVTASDDNSTDNDVEPKRQEEEEVGWSMYTVTLILRCSCRCLRRAYFGGKTDEEDAVKGKFKDEGTTPTTSKLAP